MPAASDLLRAWSPVRLPELLAAEAERRAGAPAAVYLVALEGSRLLRAAGAASLPAVLEVPQTLGSEIPATAGAEVAAAVRAAVPGATVAPLWIGARAIAVLVVAGPPREDLTELVGAGAAAIEVGQRTTDVFDRARRTRPASASAELQQALLPPPTGVLEGTALAASVMPAYEVGGDFYDWVQDPGRVRFSVADAVGKGDGAMAVSAITLSALRAARRAGDGLAGTARAAGRTLRGLPCEPFVTAVLAEWTPASATVRWLNFGHPPPVLLPAGGAARELPLGGHPPLGVLDDLDAANEQSAVLAPGDRLLVYSDGVTEARDRGGALLGVERLIEAAAGAPAGAASETVLRIMGAVGDWAAGELRDDATLLVLARPVDS